MDEVRAHVVITGDVQGVFFRATCRDRARAANVKGWVRNRADGAVEAVFEGAQAGVQRMVSWCYSGPINARIDHVDVTWEEPTGKEDIFSIAW